MERKKVFCCSRFIDPAIWFTENMLISDWEVDLLVLNKDGLPDNNLFIYEKMFQINYCDSIDYLNKIVVCCLDCFEFMLLFESGRNERMFDEIDCNYVYEDVFCYNSLIYTGNDRFQAEGREPNKDNLEKYFVNFPKTKSCFTSIQKYFYRHFCFSCKKAFENIFLKNVYIFENDSFCKRTSDLENL